MGFVKEVYSNNRAGLIVAFKNIPNSANYVNTDSIDEAIKYFNLVVKDGGLYAITDSDLAIQSLEIKTEEAVAFRAQVNTLLAALDDETALQNTILFPMWMADETYKVDDRVRYNNILYKVLQGHVSQAGWTPVSAPSLFAQVLVATDGTILEWKQPDSTNGYMTGDKISHSGEIWVSTADNNIWEPGTTGAPWKIYSDAESDLPDEWSADKVYATGDMIMFNEYVYQSTIDNNSWSPEAYPAGWTQITH